MGLPSSSPSSYSPSPSSTSTSTKRCHFQPSCVLSLIFSLLFTLCFAYVIVHNFCNLNSAFQNDLILTTDSDALPISLSIDIPEKSNPLIFNQSQIDSSDPQYWPLIRATIKRKLFSGRKMIKTGHADLPSSEPIELDSLWLVFNDDHGFLNASLHHVQVHGLSTVKLKDLASNGLSSSISVLFKVDNLQINGDYLIQHRQALLRSGLTNISGLNGDAKYGGLKEQHQLVDDNGRFVINVHNFYITWFSQVVAFDPVADRITVQRISVKSYHDNATHQFSSLILQEHPDAPFSLSYHQTVDTIVSMIVSRVQSEVESRMTQLLSKLVIQQTSKMASLAEIIKFAIENHHHQVEEAMNAAAAGALSRNKRQVPCEQGEELEEYVDSLFKFASRVVRAMEPISLPNATIELPEYNLKLFLYRGGASRAYKLQRKKSPWVYCSNDSISLGLTVGFNDLLVKYKYRAIFDWSLLFDGELEAKLEDTKLQVQFTQTTPDDDSEEDVQQRVDRIRIWRLGRVRIILKGLGNLTHAISMLLTRALNMNQEQLDPTLRRLESEALSQLNVMLKNISVPLFSIV